MYKLYDFNTRALLDVSYDELDIIETISEYCKINENYRLKIYKRNETINTDEFYKRINNIDDFKNYVKEYNNRKNTELLKAMSCQELKKEMLDLYDKPRAKIKRR